MRKLMLSAVVLGAAGTLLAESFTINTAPVINYGGEVTIGGVNGTGVKGSGKSKEETRVLEAFTRIEINVPGDIEIIAGSGGHEVELEADDNLLPLLVTKVKGDKLVITASESIQPKSPIEIDVNLESLESLSVLGSSDVEISGISGETFELEVSGSGDVESGKGEVSRLEVKALGAADISLKKLKAKTAQVSLTGTGDLSFHASDEADIELTGVGDITVYGNPPRISRKVMGVGEIRLAD